MICLLTSTFLLSCMSQKNLSSNEKNLHREWMLVSFQNFSKEKLIDFQAKMNLVPQEKTPNQYSAKMGCNNLFFTMKSTSDNKIEFSQVGSTMMFCQDRMELESAFSKELPSVKSYKFDGHYLTLSDENGNTMKFIAADWD